MLSYDWQSLIWSHDQSWMTKADTIEVICKNKNGKLQNYSSKLTTVELIWIGIESIKIGNLVENCRKIKDCKLAGDVAAVFL